MRPRHFGDYPRIPGWRFVMQYEDGCYAHGTVYAHDINDARQRLSDRESPGRQIQQISIDPIPTKG